MGTQQLTNSTSIEKSMRPIIGCLLLGIFWVTTNVALFFYVQIQGVITGLGLIEYMSSLQNEHPHILSSIIWLDAIIFVLWPLAFCYFAHKHDKQLIGSIKQMIIGWCVLLAFISLIASLVLLSIFHEGKLGDIAGFILSLLCTPFTMEFLLCIIGACLVIALNFLRLKLAGDEYVEMEIEDQT